MKVVVRKIGRTFGSVSRHGIWFLGVIAVLLRGCDTTQRDWVRARKQDNIDVYEIFLRQHTAGQFADSARQRLDELRTLGDWGEACKTDDTEVYERFMNRHPHSTFGDSVTDRIETVEWKRAVARASISSFMDYLGRYPNLTRADSAREQIERLFDEQGRSGHPRGVYSDSTRSCLDLFQPDQNQWEKAIADASTDTLIWFLILEPDTPHREKAERVIYDYLAYKSALREGWYEDYWNYLQNFPHGRHATEARNAILALHDRKAVVKINAPAVVEAQKSPYSNVTGPFWPIVTEFSETGGKAGYGVEGNGYILDPKGGKWIDQFGVSIHRFEIRVSRGGKDEDHDWFARGDHTFCNGTLVFRWTGVDEGGHKISVITRTKLSHRNCPGPNKK